MCSGEGGVRTGGWGGGGGGDELSADSCGGRRWADDDAGCCCCCSQGVPPHRLTSPAQPRPRATAIARVGPRLHLLAGLFGSV